MTQPIPSHILELRDRFAAARALNAAARQPDDTSPLVPGEGPEWPPAEAPPRKFQQRDHDEIDQVGSRATPRCRNCGLAKLWASKWRKGDTPYQATEYDLWRWQQGCGYHDHPDYQRMRAAEDARLEKLRAASVAHHEQLVKEAP